MGNRTMDVKEAECVNSHRERQHAWEVRREARSRGFAGLCSDGRSGAVSTLLLQQLYCLPP
jgi:hypothetical protein